MKRILINATIVVCAILSALSILFLAADVLNPWNPMLDFFINRISITNERPETMFVTPIGEAGGARGKIPLTLFSSRRPAFRAEMQVDVPVPGNSTIELLYLDDDFCLSDLILKGTEGAYKRMPINRAASGCDTVEPKEVTLRIPRVSQFPGAEAELAAALERRRAKDSPMKRRLLAGLPILALIWSVWYRRRVGRRGA
jgi:hypothetical protein